MLLTEFASAIDEPTPRGIAGAVSLLIRSGDLTPGERLPTVRELGQALGVSPATVSHAWQSLVGAGLIQARGRAGTFVRSAESSALSPRVMRLMGAHSSATGFRLDLASGVPDPHLLPNITRSLSRVVPPRAATSSYMQPALLAELAEPLRALWPYVPPALTIVDGAMDGVQRALELTTRFGDRVVVETPTFPLFLGLLAHMNLHTVPVAMDGEGMLPEAFSAALDAKPAAVILQPRAHNPTGISMSRARAETLAGILAQHKRAADTIVIEDDHSGGIATAKPVSFGMWLPKRTIHVQSFSKAQGPDLRIAAVSAPAGAIEVIESNRILGSGWTSRMLQAILFDLLTSSEAIDAVQDARRAYHRRQQTLTEVLTAAGIGLRQADGLNLWLPVPDEQNAQIQLAAHGIRVSLGSPYLPTNGEFAQQFDGPHQGDHIRVSIGMLRDSFSEIASTLASVALPNADVVA